jgi:hypothetical protein
LRLQLNRLASDGRRLFSNRVGILLLGLRHFLGRL